MTRLIDTAAPICKDAIREQLYSPVFKPLEFERFKTQAGRAWRDDDGGSMAGAERITLAAEVTLKAPA